jgi:hypothetical protein
MKTLKEEAETHVGTLKGEVKTLKEEAETRVGTLEKEVNLKKKAETRVRTLEGQVNGLNFKCKRAEREEKTNTEAHLSTTSNLVEVTGELEKLKGASDILTRELQEKTDALCVAKSGTALDYVISINRIPVMAPILEPILGVHFWGSIFPSKMGPFAPFPATIQALSRTRVFLLG